jgi:DNA-binding transcriptional LysR family regulator
MSHALGRLRDLFDDELFVRTPSGMEPTSRALDLEGPIRSALDHLALALLAAERFDAKTDTRTFSVGMSDWLAADVMPNLIALMRATAPNVSLRLHSIDNGNCASLLDEGVIDLAMGYPAGVATWHRQRTLFTETHVCVFNAALVKASSPITIEEYTSYPHILVSHSGELRGMVDAHLEKLGQSRQVIVSGTQFLLAAYILQGAAVIATLPKRFARRCGVVSGLQQSSLPFASTDFAVPMIWHQRNERNAAQIWLRRQIEGALESAD